MAVPETEIIIRKDGVELLRKTVPPGKYVVGRDAECDVPLDVDSVSDRHAQLTIHSDRAMIEDLGSSSGTFVNGQPVTASTRLLPDQRIQIGEAIIEVVRIEAQTILSSEAAPVRKVSPEDPTGGRKYEIGEVVAKGGMGAILNARDAMIFRSVAMKVMLNAGSNDDARRFMEEARITGQLEHPNIVPVHELAIDEKGQPYYTMKFVKGITLKMVLALLKEGVPETVVKYPLAALLTIFQKVCDAVAFAHSKHVIHRDLKPENIMIGDFGEVLLMDWGLAKVLGQRDVPSVPGMVSVRNGDPGSNTMDGTIMGTPRYMSPEQARGEIDSLDVRSDIYSLSAILFELLYLRPPVDGRSVGEIVDKVSRGEIDWTPARRPAPESLVAVCREALALKPGDRYKDVAELQHDITAYQNGFATTAERAGVGKQVALLIKRNRGIFATGFIAWVILTALLGWFVINVTRERNRAETERNHAEQERSRTAVQKDRAENALANLAKTAPTFAEISRKLVGEGDFAGALEKIGYAASLDTENPDYLIQQGNLLQATQQLAKAAESYRKALALRSDNPAKASLDVCERLLRVNGDGTDLTRESLEELMAFIVKAGREGEALPLNAILMKDSNIDFLAIKARLKPFAAFTGHDNGIDRLPNGTFKLRLLNISELPSLQGLPVTELDLSRSKVTNLAPLKGIRLKRLRMQQTAVTDLGPLVGMPLEMLDISNTKIGSLALLKGMPLMELSMENCPVSDLSPLRGMSLKSLRMDGTQVVDLRPLEGMPMEYLNLFFTAVNDLSPLAGMPLTYLNAFKSQIASLSALRGMPLRYLSIGYTSVSDLGPLAGMPIEELHLTGSKVVDLGILPTLPLKCLMAQCPVKDLSPLAACKSLERLEIPKVATDISFLRALPRMERLSDEKNPGDSMNYTPTATEFWQKYDKQ